jgi:hypothetical protein
MGNAAGSNLLFFRSFLYIVLHSSTSSRYFPLFVLHRELSYCPVMCIYTILLICPCARTRTSWYLYHYVTTETMAQWFVHQRCQRLGFLHGTGKRIHVNLPLQLDGSHGQCTASVHDITCHVIHFSIVTPIRISPLSNSLLFSSYLLAFLNNYPFISS